MGESHGSHHDHEVAVVGGTAEQVWREIALGEGAGEGRCASRGRGREGERERQGRK